LPVGADLPAEQPVGARDARRRIGSRRTDAPSSASMAAAQGLRADHAAPRPADAARRAGQRGQHRLRRPSERETILRSHRNRDGRLGVRVAATQRPRRGSRDRPLTATVARTREIQSPQEGMKVSAHPHPNQFALLSQRRFAPFFWTQFLGAANDNVFKFAFTVLVTYHLQVAWLPSQLAGLVIGAVFIAPFLLFSATSGQLADKHDKALMTRLVKNLEIVIMVLATIGLSTTSVALMLGCIFLLGVHSTLFGPVKYAY